MNRRHRFRLSAVVAVSTAAAFTLAACSSSSSSSTGTTGATGTASAGSSTAPLTRSAPGTTAPPTTTATPQPLTGPAAPGYSEIAPASTAYFDWVNANGGVYGRKIVYKYLNDDYDPTTTASVVRPLVLQDNAYAIFNGLVTP